ncbi:MAG TPA: phosphate ABC transporter permease subunit PstC [Anaerolineae bacterium]|nr:phosphate ABC transporter permease subunit PstC [Anaerolineae bacterium]
MATTSSLTSRDSIDLGELRKKPRIGETIIQSLLFLCGVISILTTIGIVYELGKESLAFFTHQMWEQTNKSLTVGIDESVTTFEVSRSGGVLEVGDTLRLSDEIVMVSSIEGTLLTVERGVQETAAVPHSAGVEIFRGSYVSLVEFFTGTEWNPQISKFGIWSLVNATFMTSLIAMSVALPVGLATAIYLSEYASLRARSILKPIMEVLAGVPTVVYGYFALTFMTPLFRSWFGVDTVQIFNTASAGVVVGILIIPLVSSMSEDALHAVPKSLREAAYGLGATRLETSLRVVLPAALSGITAAFVVAISRAIGETMIVAIAAGAGPAFTFNPFDSAETMTGHIVRISGGDLSYDSIDYNSIFAIGLLLFFLTLSLNIFSQRVVARFREVYE